MIHKEQITCFSFDLNLVKGNKNNGKDLGKKAIDLKKKIKKIPRNSINFEDIQNTYYLPLNRL